MFKPSLFAFALSTFTLGSFGVAHAATVTLNGSGSTLSKAYQETAIEEFKKLDKSLKINYGGGGSGKGRQDLADMVVDFAGSDSPYKEADAYEFGGRSRTGTRSTLRSRRSTTTTRICSASRVSVPRCAHWSSRRRGGSRRTRGTRSTGTAAPTRCRLCRTAATPTCARCRA